MKRISTDFSGSLTFVLCREHDDEQCPKFVVISAKISFVVTMSGSMMAPILSQSTVAQPYISSTFNLLPNAIAAFSNVCNVTKSLSGSRSLSSTERLVLIF